MIPKGVRYRGVPLCTLTQVCYATDISFVAIASSCIGYSSPRNGTTKMSHHYCVWVWARLQAGGHVWWEEGAFGDPIAETTLLHLGECAVWNITCYTSRNIPFGEVSQK